MWIRLRLDIGWRDLCYGFFGSIAPDKRETTQQQLESFWSEQRYDTLACLSVRSGFDLLLQALALPEGSEVLFSAVTIRDMPQIAEAHGLVPVPVDVCGSDYHIDMASLQQAVTTKSRILVVAHLFGARPDMQEVLDFAHEHNLFVVEDCAQAWCEPHWRGNEQADASLFSFGTIKTATALGGALCRVKDLKFLTRMRDIQSQEPVSPARKLALHCFKITFLKIISTRILFGVIVNFGKQFGNSVDDILGGMTRGFSGDSLLLQLRKQPNIGTLRLLKRRLETYDSQRIARRIKHAQLIIAKLGLENLQPELLYSQHSFWLFPYITDRPEALIKFLKEHGFDTTQRGRMEIVSPPSDRPELSSPTATELLSRTVFLPCYPEMTDATINRMCKLIIDFTAKSS
ncbi:aminotransferase class I/II-fold pyridoxal phosphate-dependent enzyme [Gimesia aquarii]|uniref:L-glutamine:2-deoxy-scyllo-inosose aminotransferase n=1 Tax=Gimesia aquarii TaxID=2527964 RepID=A0A517VNY7_9PLAN|nr:aminotransferase class I/II-fold pyridoxal phosphate-dependent enzyme [Gimesia aquarii]QDT94620.1 L-glutamine:2-deoxy-scyllo-inosose aminotransferase [Gimesia aquarii]